LILCFGKVAVGLRIAFKESIRAMEVAVRSAVLGSKSIFRLLLMGWALQAAKSVVTDAEGINPNELLGEPDCDVDQPT
jgi:hypothetical protein